MKKLILSLMGILVMCGTQISNSAELPDGTYYIVHFNAENQEINKPVKVDVPFNDVKYIAGGRCAMVQGVQYMILKDADGKEISKTNCH